MSTLKTNKAELKSFYPTEPMEFVVEKTGEVVLLSHILNDALAAHTMKAKIDEVSAMEISHDISPGNCFGTANNLLKQIKAVLGGKDND